MKYPEYLINEYKKKLFKSNELPFKINTVCEEAKCPNRGECFSKKTVTFLLLGNTCTRSCLYCNVKKGEPPPLDSSEGDNIVKAIQLFNLKYVVLTSVTRDDLDDGGAIGFVRVIKKIKEYDPKIKIEVLTPDFKDNITALDTILEQEPYVFNHNLEIVPSIFSQLRPQGNFELSLNLLQYVKKNYPHIKVKTGIMVGLGETKSEVVDLIHLLAAKTNSTPKANSTQNDFSAKQQVMSNLKSTDSRFPIPDSPNYIENHFAKSIDAITIGQYLQPNKKLAKINRFVAPDEFAKYINIGNQLGIKIIAGPLVRSSYLADEAF